MVSPSPDQVSEWVRIHGPYLQNVISTFSLSGDEAEDVFQEIWVIVLRKLDRAAAANAIRSWLYSITLKVCLGRIRKAKRRGSLLERWFSDVPRPKVPPQQPDIPEHFRNREIWIRVAELPDLQRQALLLRVVEEMTTEEAAQTLNRATGTVKASLSRARAKLRDLLGPEEEEITKVSVATAECSDGEDQRTGDGL